MAALNTGNGSDLSAQPMLLLHGIWMGQYNGPEAKIYAAGFKWPAEHGWGAEMFNFRPVSGKCYGHVEIMPRKIGRRTIYPQLHIEKLGATKTAEAATGVLVVWTAPDPRRPGRTVVGWYNNATVFRSAQEPKGKLTGERTYQDTVCSFRVSANASDCVPIRPEQRSLTIPPRRKGDHGVPGQFTAYYPAESGSQGRRIERQIRDFISSHASSAVQPAPKGKAGRRQSDPERRQEIEDAAVNFVWQHFEQELGYKLSDHQRANHGYDLKASRGDEVLCIEVKGRSGTDIVADFTPNEYKAIADAERGKFTKGAYRVCIVTEALRSPRLYHFVCWPSEPSKSPEWWTVDGDRQLSFTPVIAARGSAT